MGYQKKSNLSTETTVQLGGVNKKTNKPNPISIEGYYLGAKNINGTYGPGKLHIFQTLSGNVGLYGKTNSDRLLSSEHVGQMCKLVFTGMGKAQKGRNPSYNYELFFDVDNTVAVSSEAVQSFGDSEESPEESDAEGYLQEEEAEEAVDEVTPARPVMPRRAATTPSPEARAKVQALLNSRNKIA